MSREPRPRRDPGGDRRERGDPLHEGHARAARCAASPRAPSARAAGARRAVRRRRHPARPADPPGAVGHLNWPTIPQLFVEGELVGGCDIVTEMYESGELAELLGVEQPAAPRPWRRRPTAPRRSRSRTGSRRRVQRVADDVWQLQLAPRDAINAYLDRRCARRHRRQAVRRTASPGCSKVTASRRSPSPTRTATMPARCAGWRRATASRSGAAPPTAARRRAGGWCSRPGSGDPRMQAIANSVAGFGGTPVARTLAAGDALAAGFMVLETPGHSPGHVSFWRESDGTLLCGDVFFNMHLLTTAPGLHQPPALFTPDPARQPRVRARARRTGAAHGRLRARAGAPRERRGQARRLRDLEIAAGEAGQRARADEPE